MAEVRAPVFLDCSSGEPLLSEARSAWDLAASSGSGDPHRLHRRGRLAAQALDAARKRVAAHVGARPGEVVCTGPLAPTAQAPVAGLALGRRGVGDVAVTFAVPHSSVLRAAAARPIIEIARRIQAVDVGALVELSADDPAAAPHLRRVVDARSGAGQVGATPVRGAPTGVTWSGSRRGRPGVRVRTARRPAPGLGRGRAS